VNVRESVISYDCIETRPCGVCGCHKTSGKNRGKAAVSIAMLQLRKLAQLAMECEFVVRGIYLG
jgi:hypothetical protein